MLLCAAVSFFWLPSPLAAALLLIPLILDGFIQLKTVYESTNLRRVVTGFLFGYGLVSLFVISSIAAFRFGFNLLP